MCYMSILYNCPSQLAQGILRGGLRKASKKDPVPSRSVLIAIQCSPGKQPSPCCPVVPCVLKSLNPLQCSARCHPSLFPWIRNYRFGNRLLIHDLRITGALQVAEIVSVTILFLIVLHNRLCNNQLNTGIHHIFHHNQLF